MDRLLPPGTVVKLKNNRDLKIMVISRLARKHEEDPIATYCGCVIPVGFRNTEELIFFDANDIRQLIFIGLQDEEEIVYSYEASKQFADSMK